DSARFGIPSKNRATSPIKPRKSSAENRCASVESFCGGLLGRRFLGGHVALSSSVMRRKASLPITNASVEMSVRFDTLVSIGCVSLSFPPGHRCEARIACASGTWKTLALPHAGVFRFSYMRCPPPFPPFRVGSPSRLDAQVGFHGEFGDACPVAPFASV